MLLPVRAQGIGGALCGTLSVLFVFQVARRAPEYGFTKYQFNGGCEAVAANIKKHAVHVFLYLP
jgi:hypothetical protein